MYYAFLPYICELLKVIFMQNLNDTSWNSLVLVMVVDILCRYNICTHSHIFTCVAYLLSCVVVLFRIRIHNQTKKRFELVKCVYA